MHGGRLMVGGLWLLAMTGLGGCGSSGPREGTLRGPCYGNGTCNAGLTCISMVCVAPVTGGTGGSNAGSGGVPTGGSAAGMAGTGGGMAGTGGAAGGMAGHGGAAAGGASGAGGTAPDCLASQKAPVGQGDSNPNFQSGVGALGTGVMYIFSGSTTAAGDGGTDSQEIYVQAFDPQTGASKGPSQPLFAPPLQGFEAPTYVAGSVYLFAASVASTGEIALVYQLINKASSDSGLYIAIVSAASGSDGGAAGLQLRDVELISSSFAAGATGDYNNPKVFWSNASQTFVVNYASPNPKAVTTADPLQLSIRTYTVAGQLVGTNFAVPLYDTGLSATHVDLGYSGAVGESGRLLGAFYTGGASDLGWMSLTTLDQSLNLVQEPWPLRLTTGGSWTAVAGTANGFVCAFIGISAVNVWFVPVSAGTLDVDAGIPQFGVPSLTQSTTMRVTDARAVADDVGVGGRGGVGLALIAPDGVAFAYVDTKGVGIQGPAIPFAPSVSPGAMSMTNFNGKFAISAYTPATHSAQVVEIGSCP